jgi:LacI family transcriptional regulator
MKGVSVRGQSKRVLIGFSFVEALRDVLQGIISYSKAQNTNWELQCVDLEVFEHRMAEKDFDGAIAHINLESRKWLPRLLKSRMPIVNALHNTSPRLTSVLSDDAAIGQIGAESFLARGFSNFAFLGIDADWSRNRQLGFARPLRSRADVSSISEKVIRQHGYSILETAPVRAQLRSWVQKLPRPVAVMACTDLTARALLYACQSAQIAVPDEVSILGVDNLIGVCELAPVPLSSVSQDFPTIGVEAARALDKLMSGDAPPRTPTLVPPGPIIVRRSTDVYAFGDKHVAGAMQMIHKQAGYGLGMKQLISTLGVSRTWLDLRFRSLIGHTPSEEIRRVRLNRVCELLAGTDLSVQEIAERCGFGSSQNLTHFFHRGQNMSPLDYRCKQRGVPLGSIRSWNRPSLNDLEIK